MRKIMGVLVLGLSFLVAGCNFSLDSLEDDEVRLPNLEGFVEAEIIETLEALDLRVNILQRTYVELENSKQFIEYGTARNTDDIVKVDTFVTVIVSATIYDNRDYFVVADLDYDGPYLDASFYDLPLFTANDDKEDPNEPDYYGGGGVFSVDYDLSNNIGRCIDGDTTIFHYPEEIYSRITNRTPSTRYLNIDTPETYPNNEEEWGKPATNYVCDLLDEAESIVLQTDPGDFLTGNYGRLLAWIWIQLPGEDDYFLLNYMVVRQGLGEVAYLYGAGSTNVTVYDDKNYTEWMFHGENLAKEEKLGMFSNDLDWYWDYDNDRPYPGRWN